MKRSRFLGWALALVIGVSAIASVGAPEVAASPAFTNPSAINPDLALAPAPCAFEVQAVHAAPAAKPEDLAERRMPAFDPGLRYRVTAHSPAVEHPLRL